MILISAVVIPVCDVGAIPESSISLLYRKIPVLLVPRRPE